MAASGDEDEMVRTDPGNEREETNAANTDALEIQVVAPHILTVFFV